MSAWSRVELRNGTKRGQSRLGRIFDGVLQTRHNMKSSQSPAYRDGRVFRRSSNSCSSGSRRPAGLLATSTPLAILKTLVHWQKIQAGESHSGAGRG